MKKILIISPFYNGLYRYTRPLYEEIKKDFKGLYQVKHLGNKKMTFDIKEIETIINDLVEQIIEYNPDIIHYNYGTYDILQLIPYYLDKRGFKCKQILTFHSLELDIFKKMDIPELDKIVNEYVGKMDGYVFFTKYALKIFEKTYKYKPEHYAISYHPATHLDYHVPVEKKEKYDARYGIDYSKSIVTLLGYNSHWKDSKLLFKLVDRYKDVEFIVAGPWWKEKILKENAIDLNRYPNLKVINKELKKDEFVYFLDMGIGLFPYNYYKSFQGSGLLPNYLYRGIGVIVNNIEPLKEYYDGCINMYDDNELFKKFERVLKTKNIKKDRRFGYATHAKSIERLYKDFL